MAQSVYKTDLNDLTSVTDRICGARQSGGQIVAMATRSDGYLFMLVKCDNGYWVKAGCRFTRIASYRRDVAHRYYGAGRHRRRKQRETRMILDLFEQRIKRPLRNGF